VCNAQAATDMTRDPNEWMWERASELLDRADRAQRRFFSLSTRATRACWVPPIDVFENGADILILVALPGVREGDVEVALDRRDLLVTAHRGVPDVPSAGAVQRLEIPQGCFERRIPLATGTYEMVERTLRDGCLWLRLRRSP
jgi:HSP20 family molecular chaperone IbpA